MRPGALIRGRAGGAGWRHHAVTPARPGAVSPGPPGDGGMVTAELAMAIPALVAASVLLAWLLSLSATQGAVLQAAREGARAAARGESSATVRATVVALVPDATVTVRRSDSRVLVTASIRRVPPLALLRPLARDVRASATSWREGP
jgi:hypothetical protein